LYLSDGIIINVASLAETIGIIGSIRVTNEDHEIDSNEGKELPSSTSTNQEKSMENDEDSEILVEDDNPGDAKIEYKSNKNVNKESAIVDRKDLVEDSEVDLSTENNDVSQVKLQQVAKNPRFLEVNKDILEVVGPSVPETECHHRLTLERYCNTTLQILPAVITRSLVQLLKHAILRLYTPLVVGLFACVTFVSADYDSQIAFRVFFKRVVLYFLPVLWFSTDEKAVLFYTKIMKRKFRIFQYT
jgi:hypothetical protein